MAKLRPQPSAVALRPQLIKLEGRREWGGPERASALWEVAAAPWLTLAVTDGRWRVWCVYAPEQQALDDGRCWRLARQLVDQEFATRRELLTALAVLLELEDAGG